MKQQLSSASHAAEVVASHCSLERWFSGLPGPILIPLCDRESRLRLPSHSKPAGGVIPNWHTK